MENSKGERIMGKFINYRHTVEVVEYYDVNYEESEFNQDVAFYNISGITFDEVCDLLSTNCEDILITVNEHYFDPALNRYVYGPHIISGREFFTRLITDAAFEWGADDRDEIEIRDREFNIIG